MAWRNVEERSAKVFNVRISFPSGIVITSSEGLNSVEWLTSAVETDEELRGWDHATSLRVDWPRCGPLAKKVEKPISAADKGGAREIYPDIWRQTTGSAETEENRTVA